MQDNLGSLVMPAMRFSMAHVSTLPTVKELFQIAYLVLKVFISLQH